MTVLIQALLSPLYHLLFAFFDSGSWLLAPPIFGSIVFEVAPVLICMYGFRILWELTQ